MYMIFPLAVNAGSPSGQNTENRAGLQEGRAASTSVEQYEVIYSYSSKLSAVILMFMLCKML